MAQSRLNVLADYLRPYWKNSALGIAALLVVNVLGAYIPQFIRTSIDQLSETLSFNAVLPSILLILGLASVMWGVRMVSRILIFGVGRQVEFDLKQKIFNHLLTLEPAYFSRNTVGDLISRSTSDVDNIRRLLGFAVLSLANTLFAYAFILPFMLAIDVKLSLAALSVYPAMFFMVHFFSDRLRSQQSQVQQENSNISDLIQEDMSGMALIKIYAQEENERLAFREVNQRLQQANLKLGQTRNALFPLLGGLANISVLAVVAMGAGAIANNTLSIGDFVSLQLYVGQLVFPTALLGFTISAYQRGEVSLDRIEAILQAQPQIQDDAHAHALAIDQIQGRLEARHLTYSFPDSQVPALKDVSFVIEPGETVAVVGPIGSGKSTLANAIPHLLDIAPGQLWLDGYDITATRLQDLRRAIAYVPQDSFLFSTTISNNIRYGSPTIDAIDVEYAAKQAYIHAEILNFPQRYDTIVGERGITLSGGQRQRTALARALLVDAPILILDDSLSSVDNQTATAILQNLSSDTQRKTVLFISHQMAAAAMSDRIFVMDQGTIVQSGTHDELVAQAGLYQTLWEQHQLEETLRN
ncbi:MAG: ABC transporter ATP-binding protein [Leptolyngbyaceae bacterium]|nr:ABC transporter ATP-binding protein [Leptolyngbyaceae bacterium]